MIYLISQITFIFWHKFTIIWISSHRHQFGHKICLALWDQSLPTASGELFFLAHKKMHVSEYVCKTCLKELGILLKGRETFEKFLAACNSSNNTGLPQFFFTSFYQLYFKNISFLTKTKKCLLCWLLWIQNNQMTGKYLTSNTTFSKKVNPMKYWIQTYILVKTWNLLFMYFTGVSY